MTSQHNVPLIILQANLPQKPYNKMPTDTLKFWNHIDGGGVTGTRMCQDVPCVYTGCSRRRSRVFLHRSSHFHLKISRLLNQNLTVLNRLAGQQAFQIYLYLFPDTGITGPCSHVWFCFVFIWILGYRTQVLVIAQQVL